MNFSILPILYLVQILGIYRATGKTHHSGQISVDQTNQINLLLMMLTFWGGLSAYLGVSGYYQSDTFLSSLPGFWITQIAVLIVMVPWIASKSYVRELIRLLIILPFISS